MEQRLVLAGTDAAHVDEVDVHDVRQMISGCCWRKHRYETWRHARHDARTVAERAGRVLTPYRCPFSSLTGEHWHFGRPPAHEVVVKLALVIRWVTAHPDEVPAPPSSVA